MKIVVHVPAPLREHCGGERRVTVVCAPGCGVGDALERVRSVHPGVTHRVIDERGEIRRHVNVFVGTVNVRDADGLATKVGEGQEVFIMPSVSGGICGTLEA
jgi:sulfur-carrier protein